MLRMVACGARAGWRGRTGGALLQAAVVDAGHVLSPLAGRETVVLLEAGEPVAGILFSDDEEGGLLFADGEVAFHRYMRTFTSSPTITTS